MRKLWGIVILGALAFVRVEEAEAQTYYQPGTFYLGGYLFMCGPAVTLVTTGVGDWAKFFPGTPPLIALDEVQLGAQMIEVQMFTYAHECGHMNVGADESAADCWAARAGRAQGWLTQSGLDALVNAFVNSPGAPPHYAPGPIRLQNIMSCYWN